LPTITDFCVFVLPFIKKLKGLVQLPEDFDYKKELTNELSKKYGFPVLSPETTVKLLMNKNEKMKLN
jgi:hypothetical protein